jgi:hypothetical protein
MANVNEKETDEKMAPELNVDSSSISTVASMVGMKILSGLSKLGLSSI